MNPVVRLAPIVQANSTPPSPSITPADALFIIILINMTRWNGRSSVFSLNHLSNSFIPFQLPLVFLGLSSTGASSIDRSLQLFYDSPSFYILVLLSSFFSLLELLKEHEQRELLYSLRYDRFVNPRTKQGPSLLSECDFMVSGALKPDNIMILVLIII